VFDHTSCGAGKRSHEAGEGSMVQHVNSTPSPASEEDGWETIKGECPICGRKKSWCRRSTDGTKVSCRFEPQGAVHTKTDKNGAPCYIHRLVPEEDEAQSRKPRSKSAGPPGGKPVEPALAPADVDTRHEVYTALIEALTLGDDHRNDLVGRRGFSSGEAESRGFRTVLQGGIGATAKALVGRFGEDMLLKVPGFFRKGEHLTFACAPGLLIPVRDARERIVALSSRPDKPSGESKYVWVSSKSKDGPGPGSPAHVPIGCRQSETWRVTEGAIKADLATILSGIPTIGAAGATNWKPCIPILKEAGCRVVRLAYDADARVNGNVAGGLVACMGALKAEGFSIELERWDLADGKGIDDVLAAGKQVEVLAGAAAEEAIIETARAAGVKIERDARTGSADGDGSLAERRSRIGDGGEKESQAQALLRLAAPATLFHTPDRKPFATISVINHVENHPIRSASFKRWLVRAFFDEYERPPSSESLQSALGVLEAKAHYDGPTEVVHVRVASMDSSTEPHNPVSVVPRSPWRSATSQAHILHPFRYR
jgi:Domain of unknown function (DUF3854)